MILIDRLHYCTCICITLSLYSDELDPADEKVNYLKVDEASPYLIFEQGDGGCTLKGGELDALIAYAASTSSSGMNKP